MYAKMKLNWNILLNKKFSDQFGENFCFTKMGICHLFHLVNSFIATFLQPLCLVTEKFFSKLLSRFYLTRQNAFIKRCSPCCFASKNACPKGGEFFWKSKGLPAPSDHTYKTIDFIILFQSIQINFMKISDFTKGSLNYAVK